MSIMSHVVVTYEIFNGGGLTQLRWLLWCPRLRAAPFFSKCVSHGGSHLAPNGLAYLLGGRKEADLVHYLIQLLFQQLGYAIKQLRSVRGCFSFSVVVSTPSLSTCCCLPFACGLVKFAQHSARDSCSAAASFWCLSLMCLAMLLEKMERLQ